VREREREREREGVESRRQLPCREYHSGRMKIHLIRIKSPVADVKLEIDYPSREYNRRPPPGRLGKRAFNHYHLKLHNLFSIQKEIIQISKNKFQERINILYFSPRDEIIVFCSFKECYIRWSMKFPLFLYRRFFRPSGF